MVNPMRLLASALLALTCALGSAQDVTRVSDVIYAKHDGVALTMDVFTLAKPNGAAVIKIISGGWNSNHNGISDGGWPKGRSVGGYGPCYNGRPPCAIR